MTGRTTITALTIATLTLVGFVFIAPARAFAYEPMDDAIPDGIQLTGDVNSCYQTINEAFVQLQGVYMKVATTFNYQTYQWNYVVMSDAQWVDSLTDTINCDYSTDPMHGWMYTDISNPHLIHISPMAFAGDGNYDHMNHIKDFAADIIHENRHLEQMKTWTYNYNTLQWSWIPHQYSEWDAMKVQAGVLRAMNWTNGENAEGSYETFLHYRYDCSVYHQVMPLWMQNQLGFTQHIYTNALQIQCNPNDWQDPSLAV